MQVTTRTPIEEIATNSALGGGTVTGTETGAYEPLVDILMKSEFQFANTSRQIITATVRPNVSVHPLQLFIDEKQNDKKFIVTGFQMDLLNDNYEVTLTEYDNTTPINIV